MSFESPKNFKLKLAGESAGGYPIYERGEKSTTEEVLEQLGEITAKIVSQAETRSEGVREAIKAKELTNIQRKELSKAIAAALAVASPQGVAEIPADYEQIEVAAEAGASVRVNLEEIEQTVHSKEAASLIDKEVERRVPWLNNLEQESGYLTALVQNAGIDAYQGANENESRIQYLLDNISFKNNVPDAAQEVLRDIVAGQVSLESAFNEDALSPAGAEGFGQFMPATWDELGGGDKKDFRLHVQYLGDFLSNLYDRYQYHMVHEYGGRDEEGNHVFESDSEGEAVISFLRDTVWRDTPDEFARFNALSTVVSYNTGDRRWATAVKLYFKNNSLIDTNITAEDLFQKIAQYAHDSNEGLLSGFGEDGLNYVSKARLLQMALRQTISNNSNSEDRQPIQIAYNNF